MTHQDLTPSMLQAIKDLCKRYRVKELSLFGSALRDDFSSASDIDLLVEFESEAQIGFMTLSKMQRELSQILNRQVDLVPKKGLKPKIQESILSSAKVLYAP
jgi:predicted nucleotidyltransferase